MRQVTSKFFRDNFGECLTIVKDEALLFRKSGRPIAVLVSAKEYARLRFLEGLHWLSKADGARDNSQIAVYEELPDALSSRLTALATITNRSISEMIRSALEEKVEDWEQDANINEALNNHGRTWTLSELMTGKDLCQHDVSR